MRVMITGASGMTGSELARQAVANGWESSAFTHRELDIGDDAAVSEAVAAAQPDVIINAAAFTGVDAAESARAEAMRVNRDGPANLARSARKSGATMIHISTDYVFDGTSSRPCLPSDPVHPTGVYGESKLAGEIAVRDACERHAIVRTSWVYSHDGRNFVRTMLQAGAEKRELRVVNDQHGSPTAAADLASALLRAAERVHAFPALGGTYHFSNAGITTWYEFAKAIFELRGGDAPRIVPIATSDYPTVARRPAYSALDTTSFRETFDVTPRHWRDALIETLEKLN